MTACPVNLCVRDEVNNLKATWSLSKRSDIWNPLWLCVCSLICDGCFFFSPCLLISPQISDPWTLENIIVFVCSIIPHPMIMLIHSLTHIPGHKYLSPSVHCSVLCSSSLHLNTPATSSKPFKPHCNTGFHFSVTSILSGGLFFPGSVQSSTARPLSPRRASFPSCSLCVRMVSGMSLDFCSIKTPRESTYALFLILPLSMMGSNGFSSHYMVWTAVTSPPVIVILRAVRLCNGSCLCV